MKPIIFPAAVFFLGAILLPFFKGRIQKIFILAVPLIALANIFLIKPQIAWRFSILSFELIFLRADKLSLFVGYIFAFIGFLAILYSIQIKKDEHFAFFDERQILAFLYIGSALGVIFAGDFITLYIFWELMALSAAGLIWTKRDRESLGAGFRYVIMHIIGGIILLAGIITHYIISGSIEVAPVGGGVPSTLILIGIGLNAAFIPLHTWLPDAYPKASFAVSVFLSVYTTKAAVYALARMYPGLNVVAYMGAFMALFGVTMALLQHNGRKLLSYHIVSQVGYMVVGVGMGAALGVNGGIFHLFNHILYKSLLFMGIGAVIYRTGKEDLTELGGLARKMPITTTTTVIIAALSISGVPLFNGFTSKAMIFEAAHNNQVLYLILELAAVGTFLSFLKFTYFGFLRKNDQIEAVEAPLTMTIPMMTAALLNVLIGIYPRLVVSILPYSADFQFYTAERLIGSLQLFLVSGAIFYFGRKLFTPHKREILDFDYFYVKLTAGLVLVLRGIISLKTDTLQRMSLAKKLLLVPSGIISLKKKSSELAVAFFRRRATARKRRAIFKWIEMRERLEEEKIIAVREAVAMAGAEMRTAGIPLEEKQRKFGQARKAAAQRVEMVFKEKMVEEVREALIQRVTFSTKEEAQKIEVLLKEWYQKATQFLGRKRTEIVLDRLEKEYEKLGRKRTDIVLDRLKEEYEKVGKPIQEANLFQRGLTWLRSMTLVLAEVLTEGEVPWPAESEPLREKVESTRVAIRSYTRDMSFNVLIMVGLLVMFALTLLYFR